MRASIGASTGYVGSRAFVAVAALMLALAGPGCSSSTSSRSIDVVWIIVDALPARATSPYGGREDVTPQLESLAERAILIQRAYAQAPSTLPSTASFLTGVYPDRAVTAVRGRYMPLIGELLRDAGYRTAAFSENPWVGSLMGFDAGFEVFKEIATPANQPLGHRKSQETLDAALDWLFARDAEPAFLYLHLLVPHAPYTPPKPFRGMLTDADDRQAIELREETLDGRTPYDVTVGILRSFQDGEANVSPDVIDYMELRYFENLAFADHLIGRAWERIERAGRMDSTLLVISSDHGEAFGPHPQLFHGSTLYDTQTRVPLLLFAPDSLGLAPGRRTDGVVELVDLVPTILELVGIETDASFDGHSLVPWLLGEASPPEFARAFLHGSQAVVELDWKLISAPSGSSLFRRSDDPDELIDRSDQMPARVEALSARLIERAHPTASEGPARLSRKAAEELRSLGYTVADDESEESRPPSP